MVGPVSPQPKSIPGRFIPLPPWLLPLLLAGCAGLPVGPQLELTMLTGSALGSSCQAWAATIRQDPPRLPDGTRVLLRCRSAGSGDVIAEMQQHAQAVLRAGGNPEDPRIPTLVSLDGEISEDLLRHRLQALAPTRSLIPPVGDAPALASSPMVLMTTPALAPGLRRADPYQALARSADHRQLDAAAPAQQIRFVHTAPTRSNSGLQTLVAMVSEVSGKRPDQLTIADVQASAPAITAIQNHITRYGASTDQLARAMQRNGVFWASVGSVYESSVVAVNGRRQPGQDPLVAVYPRATFSSTMRAILPTAPWVSPRERQAALLLIERLQQPALQKLVADQGLRPANPAVPPRRVTAALGVDPTAVYDSLRAPRPEVVEAMISLWRDITKKPSRVALVVDTSGSMAGAKLPAVQRSLQSYLAQIGPRDVVGLIDFDDVVRPPVVLRGGASECPTVPRSWGDCRWVAAPICTTPCWPAATGCAERPSPARSWPWWCSPTAWMPVQNSRWTTCRRSCDAASRARAASMSSPSASVMTAAGTTPTCCAGWPKAMAVNSSKGTPSTSAAAWKTCSSRSDADPESPR